MRSWPALHAIQGLIILALSFARDPIVTNPVVSSYLSFDAATDTLVQAQRTLFELPLGPAVATFFFMSAIAHALLAWPLRGWYERRLSTGIQPMRWIEYALSSSVMIVIIASLSGIQEIGTLIAIFGVNAAMNLFGWSMESANQGRTKVQWNHYVFGVIAGIVPWLVIGVALWSSATEPGAAAIPTLRHRHLRHAVPGLQRLRHHDDPAVPQGRPLEGLPRRREDVHVHEPLRQDTAGLAGVLRHAGPVASGARRGGGGAAG